MFLDGLGEKKRDQQDAVLIIGVHREELPFGDAVAQALDPSLIAVLRIPKGLSGKRPRPDQLLHYETYHRELYHQLLGQVQGRYELVLDLHTGLDETGCCADVISPDPELLAGMRRDAIERFGMAEGVRRVRPVLLGEASGSLHPDIALASRTVIPRDMWNDEGFLYVGLEVYLPSRGAGNPDDRELALWLIRSAIACRG